MQTVNVIISTNFEHNLESIRCYFHQQYQLEKFELLLDTLFDKIIPNLQLHPLIGFNFLSQTVNTVEELRQNDIIKAKLPHNTSVRQYNDKDYLVLYSLTSTKSNTGKNNADKDNSIALLSIKHQQQLYFDLQALE